MPAHLHTSIKVAHKPHHLLQSCEPASGCNPMPSWSAARQAMAHTQLGMAAAQSAPHIYKPILFARRVAKVADPRHDSLQSLASTWCGWNVCLADPPSFRLQVVPNGLHLDRLRPTKTLVAITAHTHNEKPLPTRINQVRWWVSARIHTKTVYDNCQDSCQVPTGLPSQLFLILPTRCRCHHR